jgi:bifunctional non-homologous end joining protein LigD
MDDGHLRFAGKVGSGFDTRARRQLRERLDALASDASPFDPPPGSRADLRGVHWIEPQLVIRAELGGWSRDGLVRQSAYKGIDDGREPASVVRESPVASSVAEAVVDRELGGAAEAVADREVGRLQAPPKAEVVPSEGARPQGPPSTAHPLWAAATPEELAALERLGKEGRWTVGGIELKLTNLDKVLFPPARTGAEGAGSGADDSGAGLPDDHPVTKRELIAYFGRIAPAMLPHLEDRALNLQRFPDGAHAQGFWQKDLRSTDPAWLRRWREPGVEARGANTHLVADRTATLCWLGNQAAFEIHAWTSRLTAPDRPTFALIDIDPGERTTWAETLILARLFRTALGHLGVRGYPKLTGKRGIQVWVPIEPRYGYDQTSAWVEGVSRAVGSIVPELVSWEWSKGRRDGRARLDYTQNTYIKTLVAPYAVRPAPDAPVSAPIAWDELDDPDLRPDRWTIRTLPDRVAAVGDLFAPAQTDLQVLPKL